MTTPSPTSQIAESATRLGPSDEAVSQSGLPRRQNWWLMATVFLLIAGGGLTLWRLVSGRQGEAGMAMPSAIPVELQQLQTARLQDASEFVGTLEAQAGVILQPEAAGRVIQIYVASGDRVQAGQPIMELSPERSEAVLSAAQANVSAAQAARDNAAAQVRSLEAQRTRLQADLTLQNKDFDRIQSLVTEGALSQQNLDQVRRDRDSAIASLRAAEQEIQAARASLEQANASYAQAQANVASTRQDLLDKTVTAPIAGVVGDIPVKLGDYVQPGSALTTITQNESLELEIAVPVEQASQMALGMPVELMLFAGNQVVTTGAISFISPQTDPATQTVLAKARFSGTNTRLQDQQRVKVRVIWDERPGVLVPATAITRLGGQPFVYVPGEPTTDSADQAQLPASTGDAAPQQVAQLRPVQLGDMQGNYYQVVEGLRPGDTIITSGLLNLQDGMPIMEQQDEPPQPPSQ
jgi:RND family efflux transporter MFP subunit